MQQVKPRRGRGSLGWGVVSALLVCAAPGQASANLFNIFEAANGTYYAVFGNDGYDQVVLTELVLTSSAGSILSGASGTLTAFAWTTGSLFPAFGQSALIPSTVVTGFDPTGSGILTFQDGTTLGAADLGAFAGAASTLSPPPPGPNSPPYNVYGFNLPLGGYPTTSVPFFGPPPLDGIAIGNGQSLVFGVAPPLGVGRTVAYGSFGFRNSQAVIAFVQTRSFPGPPPVIPEPGALWLFGSGVVGALGLGSRRQRARRGRNNEDDPSIT